MSSGARYIVGVDLGTSNCAVACVEPALGAAAPVLDVPVRQTVRPGEVAERPLLPSCLYLPAAGEFPDGALWSPCGGPNPARVAGEFARWQGGRVPGRLVASAKSWLCHAGVDRQADILPWGAPPDVPRLSPVAAQAELLSHLAATWDAAHPDARLAQQEVVLTIPASFDEAARALTLDAARLAGFDLTRLVLLEEPQAAFYDFTARQRARLEAALAGVRLVLVADVGGGTTDFSLVRTALLPEGPALERIAVGEHLLLGGDNMDAALARHVEARALGEGRRFGAAQWAQAVQACRAAKEALFAQAAPAALQVAVASGGSRLVGGTVSAELTRAEVHALVQEGFFPRAATDARVLERSRAAVVELGLPFATDPAITRHAVAFLREHAAAGHQALGAPKDAKGLPRPDAVLLNGGVFNALALQQAFQAALSALWPDQPPVPLLPHDSLDLAVARGAAYSGLARRKLGRKIGGGAPRAYYAVVAADGGRRRGVCVVPRGLEEGTHVRLEGRSFKLTLGRPVQLQLYSTTHDRVDRPGDVIDLEGEAFKALPPIHTILSGQKGATVEVTLDAALSEVGTLALGCVAGEERWRLEFELRGAAKAQELTVTESMPARFAEAVEAVERVFGTRPLPVGPKDVKALPRTLEKALGPREEWRLPLLRELWTSLYAGAARRRRSPDHERVLYHLLGYALRPGFGYPLDAWRCQETFKLFKDLVTAHQEAPVWAEFWVLWRRVAPGLDEAAQAALWSYLRPHLERKVPPDAPAPKEKAKGIQPQGLDEMVKTAASLELLAPADKALLGGWVAARLARPDLAAGPWAWALGRLGARVPVRGAAHCVVPPEIAGGWARTLLDASVRKVDGAAFALAVVARRTGDRARDVEDEVRDAVLAHFDASGAPAAWRALVAEVVQLSQADESRALGDTLPVGLSLAAD